MTAANLKVRGYSSATAHNAPEIMKHLAAVHPAYY